MEGTTTFKNTPKELLILNFFGDKNPVGEMGKGVLKVAKNYEKNGIKNLTLKIYEGGRHDKRVAMLDDVAK